MIISDSSALSFPTLRWKKFNAAIAGGAAPVSITANAPKPITAMSRGGLEAVIFAPGHGLIDGQIVSMKVATGVSDDAAYAGTASIVVPTPDVFTYYMRTVVPVNDSVEAPQLCSYTIIAYAQRAIISSLAANASPVKLGLNEAVDHYALAPGEEYLIQMPSETIGDLSLWFFASDSDATISVIYV